MSAVLFHRFVCEVSGNLVLPRPFAMKIIMGKNEKRQEAMLQKVKKVYKIY